MELAFVVAAMVAVLATILLIGAQIYRASVWAYNALGGPPARPAAAAVDDTYSRYGYVTLVPAGPAAAGIPVPGTLRAVGHVLFIGFVNGVAGFFLRGGLAMSARPPAASPAEALGADLLFIPVGLFVTAYTIGRLLAVRYGTALGVAAVYYTANVVLALGLGFAAAVLTAGLPGGR